MSGMKTLVRSAAIVAAGFGMWCLIAPGEDARRAKLINQSNPVQLEQNRKMTALVMQAMKEAAETDENIVRRVGGPER